MPDLGDISTLTGLRDATTAVIDAVYRGRMPATAAQALATLLKTQRETLCALAEEQKAGGADLSTAETADLVSDLVQHAPAEVLAALQAAMADRGEAVAH